MTDRDVQERIDVGLKIMQDKVDNLKATGGSVIKKIKKLADIKDIEEEEADIRNATLYKQTYAKKLRFVIEPLFEKYAAKLQSEYPDIVADVDANIENSYLRFNKDDTILNIEIVYDGIKGLHFNIELAALGTEVETDNFDMEVMNFDYQKLDVILRTTINEYRNYLTRI